MIVTLQVQSMDILSNTYDFKDTTGIRHQGETWYLEVFDSEAENIRGRYLQLKCDNKKVEEKGWDDPEFIKSIRNQKVQVSLELSKSDSGLLVKVVDIQLNE